MYSLSSLVLGLLTILSLNITTVSAQIMPQSKYLEDSQSFLQYRFKFDNISETPVVIEGENCRVSISGAKTYGGYDRGFLKVVIEGQNTSKTFHHTNFQGDIQRPEISQANGTLSVGGSRILNQNHDGTSYELYHRYLIVTKKSVSIKGFDGETLYCKVK